MQAGKALRRGMHGAPTGPHFLNWSTNAKVRLSQCHWMVIRRIVLSLDHAIYPYQRGARNAIHATLEDKHHASG